MLQIQKKKKKCCECAVKRIRQGSGVVLFLKYVTTLVTGQNCILRNGWHSYTVCRAFHVPNLEAGHPD